MPRVSRKLIGSSYVHNMVQGINKEYIFQSEKEKYKYLYLMNKYSKKYQVLIIAYCIMDNHCTYFDIFRKYTKCKFIYERYKYRICNLL